MDYIGRCFVDCWLAGWLVVKFGRLGMMHGPLTSVRSMSFACADTYQRVIKQAEQAWIMERARVVITIEREMSLEERDKMCNRYWVQPEGAGGARYFQIETVDHDHYKRAHKQPEAGGAGGAGGGDADAMSSTTNGVTPTSSSRTSSRSTAGAAAAGGGAAAEVASPNQRRREERPHHYAAATSPSALWRSLKRRSRSPRPGFTRSGAGAAASPTSKKR